MLQVNKQSENCGGDFYNRVLERNVRAAITAFAAQKYIREDRHKIACA